MAWLKGLAGKAEDFLNQIDQNAAVALSQKEKQALVDNQLTEVTWDGQHQQPQPKMSTDAPIASDSYSNTSTPQSSRSNTALNSIRSSPNLSSFMPIRSASKPQKKDDELISFLNSSTPNYKIKPTEQIQTPVATREELNTSSSLPAFERLSKRSSPMQVDIVTDGDMTVSTYSDAGTSRSSSRRDTPVKELSEKLPTQIQMNKEAEELRTENGLLKSELQSFNNEMLLLLQRAKTAEKECTSLQQQLTKLQATKTQICLTLKDKEDQSARLEVELKLARQELNTAVQLSKNVKIENSRLIQESAKSTGYENEALLACRQQLATKEEEFERARLVHQQEIVSIKGTIKSFESEKENLTSQIAEARQVLNDCRSESKEWQDKFEKSRLEIAEARSEFDQYRTRAQRILHDKDKLIAELRGEGVGRGSPIDDVTAMELEQLRQERELVREEAMQVATRLKATRAELAEAEKRLEANREQAIESHARLHSSLMEEQSRRQAAEEDCRTQSEGLRSVREELSRQRSLLASKVRERETELTRLRAQLSQRPASPVGEEIESRLHALTRTLVLKQTALETVTTERNALRLQYEKLECKHRDAIARLYHAPGGGGGSVNDTDDAKARVPSFLEESPFDTSVARRVKRAYSNLDGVSIRTGVFLRRYPLARILMLCYMVLLHLWVMIVLFTYTPEIHPKPT